MHSRTEHFYLYNQYDITVLFILVSLNICFTNQATRNIGDTFSSTKNEAKITNCGRKHTKQRKDFQTF
jgi:hypothetical protein